MTAADLATLTAETLGAVYRSVTGVVVPYNAPADIGLFVERFDRGAFTASLVERSNLPVLLWHDNRSSPIGVAVAWDDRYDGLHAQFRLSTSAVAQVAGEHARDGFLTGMSVGFSPVRSTWRYAAQWNPDLGPDCMDWVTRHEARLHEVSLTPTPAYDAARVYAVDAGAYNADDATRAARRYPMRQTPDDVPVPAPTPDVVPVLAPTLEPVGLADRVDGLEQRVDTLENQVATIGGWTPGTIPSPEYVPND
jgi:HK97 family phage prohead protease